MINKKLEQLMREIAELRIMEEKYRSFISKLETEQILVKQILENAATWKTGNGQDAFLAEIEDYFSQFTQKINQLEQICLDIDEAKEKINSLITTELMVLP